MVEIRKSRELRELAHLNYSTIVYKGQSREVEEEL